ncbi:MAG: zinc-ribbon domain-containing protein [Anaerolineales bacterium]|nr:zinc-ribbon domain-containing protein [Anaerolineales bacterium]
MELGSLFLVLAVIVVVGIYLYAPFTSRARRARTSETHEVSSLKAERDRVVNSLQELDFDFKLGKIPEEDYPEQRTALLQKGSTFFASSMNLRLSQLLQTTWKHASKKLLPLNARISSEAESQVNDDDLEAMIAARRKEHKSKSAGFCPKCGKPVLVTDKFCPSCGKAVK